ncbi:hypothetical protein F5141DRAFT_1190105 [Pisolithus sp. B1]|nr:hypothetical protein F5141DRAFT_1190105 [Pisolithus sp. B1]
MPNATKQHSLNRTISLSTAQRWLHKLGYRWKKEKWGQYSDGHEHDDVVHYHQNIFLPEWSSIELSLWNWKYDDPNQEYSPPTTSPSSHHVVVWFHDESTFYANDHCKVRWEHISEDALPQPKGEGASIMVSHFVSPDYGFLHSPDGKESACVLFRAGKSCDGYYSSNDILKQAAQAMDILVKYFPEEDHIFIFDNATTHLKHADDPLSAHCREWWLRILFYFSKGHGPYFPIMGPDNKPLKMKIPMAPSHFPDGTSQPLYFPVGHPQAGWFKGMSQILQEHGYDVKGLLTEFIDAYKHGLNGAQAAWAVRKYCGHQVLPENLMAELDKFTS